MGRVVLVTGVCRDVGAAFARAVSADPGVRRVIGVDLAPPSGDLGTVEFTAGDIRNPMIAKVVAAASVDTVVHLAPAESPAPAGQSGAPGRVSLKETNVIGTMQLLAACQKAPSVRRLVVRSGTAVYGASPRDPALFTEDREPRTHPMSGWAKDAAEIEGYVRGFARRRPDVTVTLLRVGPVLGPAARTPLSAYLDLPVLPTVLGHDPRLQLLHPDDELAALRVAVAAGRAGTYNIAGDGVLLLSQIARRLGRPVLPVPSVAMGLVSQGLRGVRGADLTAEQVRLLTHGRVVDTAKARDVLGFTASHTTAETLEDYARSRGGHGRLLDTTRLTAVPDRVTSALLTRRS